MVPQTIEVWIITTEDEGNQYDYRIGAPTIVDALRIFTEWQPGKYIIAMHRESWQLLLEPRRDTTQSPRGQNDRG